MQKTILIIVIITALILGGILVFRPADPLKNLAKTVPTDAVPNTLTEFEVCTHKVGSRQNEAECAVLYVPENRTDANARTIAVPVVRIPATGPNPAEPIFFFYGGPGAPNTSLWTPEAWLLENHDVVLVGYRGAEGSTILSCPEFDKAKNQYWGKDILSIEALTDYGEATRECADRLKAEGIDMHGYTMPEVINDIEVVRQALGYEKVNLYAESYGTRLAQLYATMYPEALHRAMLVSINPPGHFVYDLEALDRIQEDFSAACAADATCRTRTDDLAKTITEVLDTLPDHWLFFPLDKGAIRIMSYVLLFSNNNVANVYDAFLSASEGDYSGLALLSFMVRVGFPGQMILGDMLAKGGPSDLPVAPDIAEMKAQDYILGAPVTEMIWSMAAGWDIELLPEEYRTMQPLETDFLIVNGTLDSSTPPENLDTIGDLYSNAQVVLLENFSHVDDISGLQPEAFEKLATTYYDTGEADASLYTPHQINFDANGGFPKTMKLVTGAVFGVLGLLLAGAVVLVRKFGF